MKYVAPLGILGMLLLSGCFGVSSPAQKLLDQEIQNLIAGYSIPQGMTEEEWKESSVYKAKRDLAVKTENPELLGILAEDEHPNISAYIAKNPNTPVDILTKFSQSEDVIVRNYLAANTNLSPELFNTVSKDLEPNVRQAAAANTNNSEANFLVLAEDTNRNVTEFLARNTSISETVMLKMTEKSHISALEILLKREDLPATVVEALKAHPQQGIREKAKAYGLTTSEVGKEAVE